MLDFVNLPSKVEHLEVEQRPTAIQWIAKELGTRLKRAFEVRGLQGLMKECSRESCRKLSGNLIATALEQ